MVQSSLSNKSMRFIPDFIVLGIYNFGVDRGAFFSESHEVPQATKMSMRKMGQNPNFAHNFLA
jgi:hypothetical protein